MKLFNPSGSEIWDFLMALRVRRVVCWVGAGADGLGGRVARAAIFLADWGHNDRGGNDRGGRVGRCVKMASFGGPGDKAMKVCSLT